MYASDDKTCHNNCVPVLEEQLWRRNIAFAENGARCVVSKSIRPDIGSSINASKGSSVSE